MTLAINDPNVCMMDAAQRWDPTSRPCQSVATFQVRRIDRTLPDGTAYRPIPACPVHAAVFSGNARWAVETRDQVR